MSPAPRGAQVDEREDNDMNLLFGLAASAFVEPRRRGERNLTPTIPRQQQVFDSFSEIRSSNSSSLAERQVVLPRKRRSEGEPHRRPAAGPARVIVG